MADNDPGFIRLPITHAFSLVVAISTGTAAVVSAIRPETDHNQLQALAAAIRDNHDANAKTDEIAREALKTAISNAERDDRLRAYVDDRTKERYSATKADEDKKTQATRDAQQDSNIQIQAKRLDGVERDVDSLKR